MSYNDKHNVDGDDFSLDLTFDDKDLPAYPATSVPSVFRPSSAFGDLDRFTEDFYDTDISDVQIRPGEESRTEYITEPGEPRGVLATLLLGPAPSRVREVHIPSPAVQRERDKKTIADIRRDQRVAELQHEDALRSQVLKRVDGVNKLKKLAIVSTQLDSAMNRVVENEKMHQATFPVRLGTAKERVQAEYLEACAARLDRQSIVEQAKQKLLVKSAETRKMSTRLLAAPAANTNPAARTPGEIEALARRSTVAALAGSVEPSSRDKWLYPIAGSTFLAYYLEDKNQQRAEERTCEVMIERYTDLEHGRLFIDEKKARAEYDHYLQMRDRAEREGKLGAIGTLWAKVNRAEGDAAFGGDDDDDINN
jgi:hypothetical protein